MQNREKNAKYRIYVQKKSKSMMIFLFQNQSFVVTGVDFMLILWYYTKMRV